ncbi:glycerophosphocholine cholinephosphodiesterase ENPP6-like [Palaemon carinicauda]|uniref:glycerophosphocholine cholinephosphodiesterase ENPP6-like n=1 Tax=Palaemon carinicauda TaxID=392227 RepID=UPI0035B5DA5B
MGPTSLAAWGVVLVVISASVLQVCHSVPQGESDLEEEDKPRLLYILLDGFRSDYLEMWKEGAFPAFKQFLEKGVRARWTNPIFPTLSFPSWTTLSTGLYPENHNIIGNYFYDRDGKDAFRLDDSSTTVKSKWWTSEPIWITAEKAGLKTAQIKWSRCEVPVANRTTHYCETYKDEEVHLDNFLKSIMKALKMLQEGYEFVQVYTVEPDVMGHAFGPRSPQVLQTLQDLDSVLSILMDELDERGLSDNVNIVIVSDHGMQYVRKGSGYRYIDIDSYLDTSLVEKIADRNAVMNVYVPASNFLEVYNQVSRIPGVSAYKKTDIPEEFHFKRAKYVPDILLVANDGYLLMPSASDKQVPPRRNEQGRATHGMSPQMPSMRGIFFAKGPAFQQGVVIDPIDLVDVYQVLTTVLDIVPLPHNGTWSNVEPAFAESSHLEDEDEEQLNGASTPVVPLVLSLLLVVLSKGFF